MENRVSITIPPADLKAINDAVKVLQEKLGATFNRPDSR